MNKHILAIIAVSATAFAASACTHNPADMPPGEYEKTSSSTDTHGTTTTKKHTTDVTVDEDGNKKAVVKTKTTRDPEGLFNKTSTKSKEVYKSAY